MQDSAKNGVALSMRVVLIITVLLGFGNILFLRHAIPRVNKQLERLVFMLKKFNGEKPRSGEKFSNDSLTAAHKKLKFGTYVLVRNLKNDSTVDCEN
jgi:hypothetical protein